MRYFKYKNTNQNRNNALKEQYKTLTEEEKRTFRREKRWRQLSKIVSMVVFNICIAVAFLLVKAIPAPDAWPLKALALVGKGIAGFLLLILGSLLTFGLTMPLWKKAESFHLPTMKKEIFSKACGHLREYYELQEPYIITKCFAATDRKFQNHDVCLFVVRDELRITTDLLRGFLHGERDLGCYGFEREEITILKQQDGNRLVAELKAGDTVFVLGYRAKGFVEKHFPAKTAR